MRMKEIKQTREIEEGSGESYVKEQPLSLWKRLKLHGTNTLLRYLGRVSKLPNPLYDDANVDPFQASQIDQWLDYTSILSQGSEFENACSYIDSYLSNRTLLVAHHLTIADIAVWSTLAGITDLLSWPLKFVRNLYRRNQHGRTVGRGSIAGRNRTGGISAGGGSWRCSTCTFANTQGLSSCEMCGTGRGRGGNENVSSAVRSHTNDNNRSGNLSLEELRGNENVSPAGGRGGNENVSSAVRSRSNDDDNRSGNFSLEELRSRSNVNNRSGNLSLEELRRRRIERFGG